MWHKKEEHSYFYLRSCSFLQWALFESLMVALSKDWEIKQTNKLSRAPRNFHKSWHFCLGLDRHRPASPGNVGKRRSYRRQPLRRTWPQKGQWAKAWEQARAPPGVLGSRSTAARWGVPRRCSPLSCREPPDPAAPRSLVHHHCPRPSIFTAKSTTRDFPEQTSFSIFIILVVVFNFISTWKF